MKKTYIEPKFEIFEFDTEDVITTSGDDSCTGEISFCVNADSIEGNPDEIL